MPHEPDLVRFRFGFRFRFRIYDWVYPRLLAPRASSSTQPWGSTPWAGVEEAPITVSRSRSNAFIQSEGVRLASATELPDERRRVDRSSFIAAICCAWNSRSHSEGVRSIDLSDERRRVESSSLIAAACCAWNSLSHSEGVRSVVKSPPPLESDAGQLLVCEYSSTPHRNEINV
jgi:hypothetical protein